MNFAFLEHFGFFQLGLARTEGNMKHHFSQQRKAPMLAWTRLEAGERGVVESFRMTGLGDCFDVVCGRERGLVKE